MDQGGNRNGKVIFAAFQIGECIIFHLSDLIQSLFDLDQLFIKLGEIARRNYKFAFQRFYFTVEFFKLGCEILLPVFRCGQGLLQGL